MTELDDLYSYADTRNIDVDWFMLNLASSLSAPLIDGSYVIAIDPTKLVNSSDEKTQLGHELGHCETGSFYTPQAPYEIRQRFENRADRWAINKLITKDELNYAVSLGYTEPWELAEYFGVTELFMKKAMWLHSHGNMAFEF